MHYGKPGMNHGRPFGPCGRPDFGPRHGMHYGKPGMNHGKPFGPCGRPEFGPRHGKHSGPHCGKRFDPETEKDVNNRPENGQSSEQNETEPKQGGNENV